MNHLKKSGFLLKASLPKSISLFLFVASLLLFSNFSFAQVQTQKAVYSKIGAYVNAYYESLPVDYASNSTKKYPLLIFIHGVGEVGNGSTSQLPYVLKNGPPKMLNAGTFPSSFTVAGKSHSFIVISPQLNDNNYTAAPTAINDIINYCKQKYRVDETRIYLTGLSMGGTMTWQFGGKSKANADKIAAALTVCGSVSLNTTYVNNIATSKLPIWSTVNSGDPVMSATSTTYAINAINAFVPTPPKALVDVFPVSGHDAWTKTYDPSFTKNGLNVYQWMLSYTRGGTSTPAPAPAPAAPVANAGANQVITLPTNSITVDGTKSTASGGSITNYTWSKVSGPTATITSQYSSKTTITGLVAGSYQFKLTIKDSNGNTASASVAVTVNAASSSSTLKSNAGANQTITLPSSSVTLDGTASSGPSGLTHTWKQTGGPKTATIGSIYSIKTTVSGLTTAGDYSFQLELKDPNGNTATSTIHIVVNAAATSTSTLKPDAGSDQTITLPQSTVNLDGTGSSGPVGLTHIWKQVGGPKTATMGSIYSIKTAVSGLTTAGDYSFQLELKDTKGNTATSTVHIIVNSSASSVFGTLHSNAGSDQTITQPVSAVVLDGSKSTLSSATDQHIWTQEGGPVTANIVSPYSIKTDLTGLTKAGEYLFLLKLTNSDGKTSKNYTHVTVIAGVSSSSTTLHSNAGPDETIKQPASSTMLDGSRSSWTGSATHVWSQEGGPSTANIKYPYSIKTDVTGLTKTGEYLFLLTLTGSDGRVSRNYTHVTVVSNVSARTSSLGSSEEDIAADDGVQMASPLLASSAQQLTLMVNPNPVISNMNMRISGKATGRAILKVYNMQGQVLMQQAFLKDAPSTVNRSFNVSTLASGIYIAEVMVDNKYKQVARIVKQ